MSVHRKISFRYGAAVILACLGMLVTCALPGCGSTTDGDASSEGASPQAEAGSESSHAASASPLQRNSVPAPNSVLAAQAKVHATAQKILDSMSLTERVGQTVMAPINVATTAPSQIRGFVRNGKVGSVLLLGNWNGGTQALATITSTVQGYAPQNNRLLIATDQEGGLVQHLQGPGFSRMPSAQWQGTQSLTTVQRLSAGWGKELKAAGVNVNLAPVLGTVQTAARSQNAPIGALDRDFGQDAAGNAASAGAFIAGMRDAGVMTSIKHYPGLGAVTGNTDFTTHGIVDTTTVIGGQEEGAFVHALAEAQPDMVMMSLATYSAIDSRNPAAFSSKLITDRLRGELKFDGVVTSDSLSAAAVSGIPPNDLGVKFLEAGGDLVCVGTPGIAQQIIDGLQQKASASAVFRQRVDESALRVLTLKVRAGLARG